mgnify:CR=1 FL=1
MGHHIPYYMAVLFIVLMVLFALRNHYTSSISEGVQRATTVRNYLFFRSVADCLSFRDEHGILHPGTYTLTTFTDERLKACTSEPVAAKLVLDPLVYFSKQLSSDEHLIATVDSLKKPSSDKEQLTPSFSFQQTVLTDGKKALLTIEVYDA